MGSQVACLNGADTCCMQGGVERIHNVTCDMSGPTSHSSSGGEYNPDRQQAGAQVVGHLPHGFESIHKYMPSGSLYEVNPSQRQQEQPPPTSYIDGLQGQVLPPVSPNGMMNGMMVPPPVSPMHANSAWKNHFDPTHPPDVMAAAQFDGPQGYAKLIALSRAKMTSPPNEAETKNTKNNKYGGRDAAFPKYELGRHVPTLALINPMSGAKVGRDILTVARYCPVYQDRFFDIVGVVKDGGRGGLLDVFRMELNAAKDEALKMGTRPRIISGGGDGTGSFTLTVIFKALAADNSRANEGLRDTGNGFIWTDDEMRVSFPAIAQMPLGSANDFANISGWGQQFPGSANCCFSGCGGCFAGCSKWTKKRRLRVLLKWLEAIMEPATQVSNFDVWGIMPAAGTDKCNFKLAELGGKRGRNPKSKGQLAMKEAPPNVPFFILLYFSTGFGAYLCARFSINRRTTPFRNRLEYVRQALGMITERCPPQLNLRTSGVRIDCHGPKGGDGEADLTQAQAYFPPRRGKRTKGSRYREVGFYNVNWQAHALHGADRAPLMRRLFFGKARRPVKFNDGLLDMYRMRFKSYFKNPGVRMQTDKRKDMAMTFEAKPGKGVFVQYDGESRFAFSPTGDSLNIYIRKVLNIPIVIGPYCKESLTGNLKEERGVSFEFGGETPEMKQQVRMRLLKSIRGELDAELNATPEEISAANIPMYQPPHEGGTPAPKNPKTFYNAH